MSDRAKRPRVVHVITRLIVGGAQLSVLSLCEGLLGDYDVQLITGPQTGPEGSLHERAAAAVPLTVLGSLRREVNPIRDAEAAVKLRWLLHGLDPDIIHTHSSKAGIVGRFAAAPLPARTVHTIHGWGHTPADSRARRALFIALERAAARRCDALIAVSGDNRAEGLALGIGLPDRYRVIPEIVDLEPIDPDFRRSRARARGELEIAEDVELIGWVGRFVDQKDPRTLSTVLTTLLRARPESRAVLVGDGPRRAEVEAALDAAGVGESVTFTGVVDRARRLMAAFDVLIHPSLWEGQPLVVQEALAERIPVVATRASGISELIEDALTGFVVEAGAADRMSDAAAAVLDSPAIRAPLDGRLIAHLKQDHGRAVALERHREIYDELLRHPR